MTLSLKRAAEAGLARLYNWYLRQRKVPFFIDVSGPPPLMRWDDFTEYCTENESWMMLCHRGKDLVGCCHFRDKQPGLELANFDTVFFDTYPAPNSNEARDYGNAFRMACKKQKLSRVQLLALKDDGEKIAFLESIGFRIEGVLREHFFFSKTFQDLTMLGWTGGDRVERMAALVEDDDPSETAKLAKPAHAALLAPKKKTPPKTLGIFSRRAEPTDIDLLIRWYGHPLIQETIEDEELTGKALRTKAKKLTQLDAFRDGECAFIIEFDGEPVAFAHYMWIDWVSRTSELDWFLAPDNKVGPFLANAAIREFARIAFDGFALRKVYGFTYASNDISVRLNNVWLETEATLKDYIPGADVYVQSLLASDFERKFSRRQRDVNP